MELGKELSACPYYGTRVAARKAQVGTNNTCNRMVMHTDFGDYDANIDDNSMIMIMI